jgi:hypothetical protein
MHCCVLATRPVHAWPHTPRPDVAKWLPDDWLQHLFDDASEDEALTALAALALLPEGWATTKTSRQTNPRTWMGHYLTAVSQVCQLGGCVAACTAKAADANPLGFGCAAAKAAGTACLPCLCCTTGPCQC